MYVVRMTLHKLLLSGLLVAALSTGACTKETPASPSTSCTFSVGQLSIATFPPEGGSGTAPITAGANCAWTAVSNASFITITQGASGTSNGTVQFSVAANAGAERTGTMTIGGTTTTITQRAASAPPSVPTLSAPVASSPVNAEVTSVQPALQVTNAASTGSIGTVTYRFEVSTADSFPSDPAQTRAIDGIPQGSGTTSWTVAPALAPGVVHFWRARATDGTTTGAYSTTATFRTASACAFTLSTNNVAIVTAGGAATVTVTADSSCAWTAASNASFIAITSGTSGTGNGTVGFTVAQNTGTARVGTLTIAGQTVTVTQQGTNLIAAFRLLDPGRTPGAVTECQIRSLTSVPTQCILESTSFPLGTNAITSYTWTVSYIYPSASAKNLTQAGTNPRFSFTDLCGQTGSTDSGAQLELKVTLTVTDTEGSSATATSNAGSQPLLTLRAYVCGV